MLWPRLYIDQNKCQTFVDLIGQYKYLEDEKRGTLKQEPDHDFTSHAADTLRYLAVVVERVVGGKFEDEEVTDVAWQDSPIEDEYMGTVDPNNEHNRHPMLRGVDIGRMGH